MSTPRPLEKVPLAIRHTGEREMTARSPRQIVEPRPGVDLVKVWMGAKIQ